MNKEITDDVWYRNAIFYSLDVETFQDSNGDGIGDFPGLASRLDYLAGLGISCIWLLPFYPSPNRDNGYDVMDYYNVDPRLGDLGDFAAFLYKCQQLGIRVLIDLVVNHTSICHPWFEEARSKPESPYRDFYVWSDEPLAYEKEHLMFQGEENTMWTYDEQAGQYYLHRFYKEQPDLNISNPAVQHEILKIMGYWLALGVSGFRIDAAEMLIEPYGLKQVEMEELAQFFDDMRDFMRRRNPEAVLLAEVNAVPEKTSLYLSGGERMQMLFNFYLNQYQFLAMAREDAGPLQQSLSQLPPLHPDNQWLNFLRHHDELNVKLLAKDDQQAIFDRFGPEPDMQVFGFGIRRRLAPMMEGSLDRLKLSWSLLFSLPGVPLIRYGDEIGMGEDLSLPGRVAVRTPMQWRPSANGGFSVAPSAHLTQRVIDEGPYGFREVNVLTAQQRHDSLLNWIERLITTRRQCPEIGLVNPEVIKLRDQSGVLVHRYTSDHTSLLLLHNLTGREVQLEKDELGIKGACYLVFCDATSEDQPFTLPPYGFRWLREG